MGDPQATHGALSDDVAGCDSGMADAVSHDAGATSVLFNTSLARRAVPAARAFPSSTAGGLSSAARTFPVVCSRRPVARDHVPMTTSTRCTCPSSTNGIAVGSTGSPSSVVLATPR
jgi:hypothetical protein